MKQVELAAKELLEEKINTLGYELVDVEYVNEGGRMSLNLYIYDEKGISVGDCEKVSRAIDPVLEDNDITEGRAYMLGVLSPGERVFKNERDYQRNINNFVEVSLKTALGNKYKFRGTLVSLDEDTVTLDILGEKKDIPRGHIKQAKPYIGFK